MERRGFYVNVEHLKKIEKQATADRDEVCKFLCTLTVGQDSHMCRAGSVCIRAFMQALKYLIFMYFNGSTMLTCVLYRLVKYSIGGQSHKGQKLCIWMSAGNEYICMRSGKYIGKPIKKVLVFLEDNIDQHLFVYFYLVLSKNCRCKLVLLTLKNIVLLFTF